MNPEYIQVKREDLRVGQRFDYRNSVVGADNIQRTLTNLDPIEYDMVNPNSLSRAPAHITLNPEDITSDMTFWVHVDDIEPTETERPASEQWAGADASARVSSILRGVTLNPAEAEVLVDIVRSRVIGEAPAVSHVWAEAHDAGYAEGVRDGYAKAQSERRPVNAAARRPPFTREDALVAAVKAIGGSIEASHALIPLAQQIEAYVNGTDAEPDTDSVSVDIPPTIPEGLKHPTVDIEFPDVIETDEDAALPWPDGTKLVDKDGDGFTRRNGSWSLDLRPHSNGYKIDYSLRPATIIRLGGES